MTIVWAENGGIIGRGATGVPFDAKGGTAISLHDAQTILKFQGTTIRRGDILVFRTGWVDWYKTTGPSTRHDVLCVQNEPGAHRFIGLKSEETFVEWLWDNRIAAVAGDQPAFECTPPPDDWFGWLHEHLLAGLWCPIGEQWDTDGLALACRVKGRYSFLLSSCPLVFDGGAASTANAIAIL
ncbi:hypothetical protein BDV12DRAFT_207569 [Aspergillus spectabilis]